MIKSKENLRNCLRIELGDYYSPIRFCLKLFVMWLKGNENYSIWKFLYLLRYYEYYLNKTRISVYGKFVRLVLKFFFYHHQRASSIFIYPNQCGEGLRICHTGFRYFNQGTIIGRNCSVLPMVLIGMKDRKEGGAIIGDDVDISTGVTILSPIKIGNNIRIGAGAVVTKDIPDNSIVAGVPARIIRKYNKETDYFRKDN